MCDTLVIRNQGVTWFAKNSDREPDEPQALIFRDRVTGDGAARVRCTYIEIPQVATRHAVLLSQPVWLWGGEIGVNEHGVAIGNEAVFSHTAKHNTPALLGMDLLRLGLERGASAREALEVITTLLMAHGQGGPGGYRDKNFRYDNSFIIADAREAWVLETAGRLWAARRVPDNSRHAISNCYSLGSNFDLSSPDLPGSARALGLWNGKGDFHVARAFETWLYPFVGGAWQRRKIHTAEACETATATLASMVRGLRSHGRRGDEFTRHDNRQVCLHAGSMLRPSQTTASLVARLSAEAIDIAATGTSAPCLSLFQSVQLGQHDTGGLVCAPGSPTHATCWFGFEPVHHRALFDAEFRSALHQSRDSLEGQFINDSAVSTDQARAWHEHWQAAACAKGATPSPADRHHRQSLRSSRLQRWWRARAERELQDANMRFGG